MRDLHERETVAGAVVPQAADVVAEAVRASLQAALQAAQLCGCHRCRTRAVQTYEWAVGLLALAAAEPGR
jgi:hypothetical protein